MIDIKYGNLFSVELLHNYFSDGRCPDFDIVPSIQTQKILSGHQMIAKQFGNKLFVGTSIDGSGKPFIMPEEGLNFTFFLKLKNPLFLNYTNLLIPPTNGMIYYFSNRNNNASGGGFLTKTIKTYTSNDSYEPGNIVVALLGDPLGNIYQAWRKSNAGNSHSCSDTNYWVNLRIDPCVSENDAVKLWPTICQYVFTPPNSLMSSATILVKGFNTSTGLCTETVLSKTITFPSQVNSFKLDLTSVTPGNYLLQINSEDPILIYLNEELNDQNVFGVIDLYCESTLASGYKIMDTSNHLLSPAYKILFPNRALLWKYILQEDSKGTILDDPADFYQFETPGSDPPNTIISKTAIPFTAAPKTSFKLTIGTNNYNPIANASPERLSSYTYNQNQPDHEILTCSEIYLNY